MHRYAHGRITHFGRSGCLAETMVPGRLQYLLNSVCGRTEAIKDATPVGSDRDWGSRSPGLHREWCAAVEGGEQVVPLAGRGEGSVDHVVGAGEVEDDDKGLNARREGGPAVVDGELPVDVDPHAVRVELGLPGRPLGGVHEW